jgi:hypothetical protein
MVTKPSGTPPTIGGSRAIAATSDRHAARLVFQSAIVLPNTSRLPVAVRRCWREQNGQFGIDLQT